MKLLEKRFKKFPAGEGEADGEKLEQVEDEFSDEVMPTDRLIAMLVAVGEKDGGDIDGFFESRENFDEFIKLLNSMGVNCVVDFDPPSTMMESFSRLFEEDGENPVDELLEKTEVKVHVYMSKNEYPARFFRFLKVLLEVYPPLYHRKFGEFLGFNEKNIESFVYENRSRVYRGLASMFGETPPGAVLDTELLEEKDLDEYDAETFRVFSFGKVREDTFQEELEKARDRRETLEEYGVDTGAIIDELDSFG